MANTPISNYRLAQSAKKKLKRLGSYTNPLKPSEAAGIRNALKVCDVLGAKKVKEILKDG